MTRHCGRVLLSAMVAVLPALGCASGPLAALSGDGQPPAGAAVARGKGELPPQQAAEACLATARAMEQQGHDAEAIAEYEMALQHNPRLARDVVRRLAVLYDRQGDQAKAEAAYAQALQASPKDADLLNDVGYFNYERGDQQEAEKDLRQALAVNPQHRRAWINLGLVLGEQCRYEESYQAFVHVLSHAEASSNVGVILAEHGNTDAARKALHEALAAQPDLKQARAVLNVLERPDATAARTVRLAGSAGAYAPAPQLPEAEPSRTPCR